MAEPLEPKRPAPPPGTPGAPLPRLWKTTPDDETEDDEDDLKSKKKKKAEPAPPPAAAKAKKRSPAGDKDRKSESRKGKDKPGGEKGVLIEETPNLDTYETRQRVRIALGVGALAVVLLVGWVVVRFISPEHPPEEAITPEMLAAAATGKASPAPPGGPRVGDDKESRILFERAREVARNGKPDLAVALLKTIVTKYPTTVAAQQAREALDRPNQKLPLFLDRPAVVATPGAPPPPEPTAPPAPVVEASKTTVPAASGAQANLVPPANPAEPPRTPTPEPAPSPGQEKPTRPLPKGFRQRPGSDVHASGWPLEIVGDRDGAPMVFVAGAEFIQGRDDADAAEGPAHKVTLGSFYIDKHEVTVRQFNLYQKEDGKARDRVRHLARDPALASVDSEDDRPVVLVTAREASDFCYWAGKRLPTEAQWEAAARTPDGRFYPWGTSPPKWSKPRAPRQIDPVMSFPDDASPYGALDLAGNAWEWTKDWYDPRYYQQFRSAPANNPTGPLNRPRSQQLVVKGSAKDWVVSRREGIKFDARMPYLGFRGALQVEGPGNAFEPPPAPGQPAPPGGQPAGGSSVPF